MRQAKKPCRPPGAGGLRPSRWVGRLAGLGAPGWGECSLARRPRGLRKEVVTLKSLSKSTGSSAKLICSQETPALTPLTWLSRGVNPRPDGRGAAHAQ